MDEKKFHSPRRGSPKPGYLDHQQAQPRTTTNIILSWGRSRLLSRWVLLATLVVLAITCHNYRSFSQQARTQLINLKHSGPLVRPVKKVPLEAHIISKCPDTRDAFRLLILVMQRVWDKVDFKLNYIGTPTDNDGVDCKHGPQECMGNIIELCARELYPDPKINLGFIMCLTKDYAQIPDRTLVEDCALEHAIDFKALNACAARDDGAHGLHLLRESINRTAEAKVTSCTIRLNEKIYFIRDGSRWKDCPSGGGVNELVDAIEHSFHRQRG